jgi:Type II secretion system (T2SS), protein M subtype b
MRPRLSRAGAFGLAMLVAMALVLVAVAAAPFLWTMGTADARAEARDELAFLETKLQTAGKVKPSGFTAADDITPVFIAGATPGLALADVQRRVERLAAENGMALIRSQPAGEDAVAGLAPLRMDIETAGSLEGLRGLLHALETGTPFIFVASAKIAAGRPEDGTLPADKLTASLQLEVFAWQEAKP